MGGILIRLVINLLRWSWYTVIGSMLKESDIESGRWIPLIKHIICYGGFAGGVFWRVSNYNRGMYNVRWSVLGVIRLLGMIGMLLWVVPWRGRVGIWQDFQLCCKRELELRLVWQILFLTYVVQKVETLLVEWLYFFGKYGLHVMMSFGMTLIILQQVLEEQH